MSLVEDAKHLRMLARAFATGELSQSEYRRQRRVMVEIYTGENGRPSTVNEPIPIPKGVGTTLRNYKSMNPADATIPSCEDDDITVLTQPISQQVTQPFHAREPSASTRTRAGLGARYTFIMWGSGSVIVLLLSLVAYLLATK